MSRKSKLLLFLFIILAVLLIASLMYIAIPQAKAGMDYYLGPTGANIIAGLANAHYGATTSPFWVTNINPNLLWIGMGLGIVATVLIFNPIKDGITGFFAGRHKVNVVPQTVVGGSVRSTTPVGATTRPVQPEVVVQQEQPKPEEKPKGEQNGS